MIEELALVATLALIAGLCIGAWWVMRAKEEDK